MTLTRVLLIESSIYSHFVKNLVRRISPGAEIIGTAKNAENALALISTLKPHLLIIDIRRNNPIDGFDILTKIRSEYPEALIIGHTDQPDHPFILRAVSAGVIGFISDDSTYDEIIEAIQTVSQGYPYLPPPFQSLVVESQQ